MIFTLIDFHVRLLIEDFVSAFRGFPPLGGGGVGNTVIFLSFFLSALHISLIVPAFLA